MCILNYMDVYEKIRTGAVIINGDTVLLIHRINPNRSEDQREYYVFPGGGVEAEETPEEGVLREVAEETSLTVRIEKVLCRLRRGQRDKERNGYTDEIYYLCQYVSGEPKLDETSPEKQKTDGQRYSPGWYPIKDIIPLNLYPAEVKHLVIEGAQTGFTADMREITVT